MYTGGMSLAGMRTAREQIKLLLESAGKSAYWLAGVSGVPRSQISEILAGKKIPTDAVLTKIGPKIGADVAELKALAAAERLAKNRQEDELADVLERLPGAFLPRTIPTAQTKPVLFAGEVGCGRKLEMYNADTIPLPVDVAERGDFAVRACGDSMNLVPINDGDILIVRATKAPKPGQIVIANHRDTGATCKRFKRTKRGPYQAGAYLVPESSNPEHKQEQLTEEHEILGVVVYAHRPGISFE